MKLFLKSLAAALGGPSPRLSQHPAKGRRRGVGAAAEPARRHKWAGLSVPGHRLLEAWAGGGLLFSHMPTVRLGVLS